jgi:hypothetical protein
MHTNLGARTRRLLLGCLLGVMVLSLFSGGTGSSIARAQEAVRPQPVINGTVDTLREMSLPAAYYTADTIMLSNGKLIKKHIINGSPEPPPGFELERQPVALPKSNGTTNESIGLPGSVWLLGCSAGAATDVAAMYDQPNYTSTASAVTSTDYGSLGDGLAYGWTNLYTGPTNGGVMPLGYSPWPTWKDAAGDTYSNNPLVASHMGVDGRTTRGTIDDYWVSYESGSPDPYITGGWSQHAWGDAVGDYMYTSQSAYGNDDGATAFYVYQDSTDPLTCDVMASASLPDGTLGRKRFYEARGYSVGECYNQPTDNVIAGGFSFAQLKAEIDAGRPVMLGLSNHSVVAVGYDATTNMVYIHDGWDYNTHSMIWGQGYLDMALEDVSIVNILPPAQSPGAFNKNSPASSTSPLQPVNISLSWGSTTPLTRFQYCIDTTNDNSCANWTDNGKNTSVVPPNLQSNTTYYWHVRAYNGSAGPTYSNGSSTAFWSFTTEAGLPQTFADVLPTHSYYNDIEILYANGLTAGCSTSPLKFCPDQIMNRGESAVFMLRANFGSSFLPTPPTHIFKDDWTKGTWAKPWAEAMYFNGLSAGCSSSPLKYCPWDQIPREQAVIFALRMKYGTSYIPPAATGTLFADLADVNYYATSWAEQAYKDGLIPNCGMSGGKPKICSKALVSRGLGAYMIVRAKNLTMP